MLSVQCSLRSRRRRGWLLPLLLAYLLCAVPWVSSLEGFVGDPRDNLEELGLSFNELSGFNFTKVLVETCAQEKRKVVVRSLAAGAAAGAVAGVVTAGGVSHWRQGGVQQTRLQAEYAPCLIGQSRRGHRDRRRKPVDDAGVEAPPPTGVDPDQEQLPHRLRSQQQPPPPQQRSSKWLEEENLNSQTHSAAGLAGSHGWGVDDNLAPQQPPQVAASKKDAIPPWPGASAAEKDPYSGGRPQLHNPQGMSSPPPAEPPPELQNLNASDALLSEEGAQGSERSDQSLSAVSTTPLVGSTVHGSDHQPLQPGLEGLPPSSVPLVEDDVEAEAETQKVTPHEEGSRDGYSVNWLGNETFSVENANVTSAAGEVRFPESPLGAPGKVWRTGERLRQGAWLEFTHIRAASEGEIAANSLKVARKALEVSSVVSSFLQGMRTLSSSLLEEGSRGTQKAFQQAVGDIRHLQQSHRERARARAEASGSRGNSTSPPNLPYR